MKMKKLMALVLALTLVLALAACGQTSTPAEGGDTAAPAEGEQTLIVYTARSGNHIDAQCEGDETEGMFSFGAISYRDPLGDVELGDTDDTGICLHYIDTDIDDPVTDVNFTGTSTMHMDDDDEEPTTDVDVTGRGIAHLVQ